MIFGVSGVAREMKQTTTSPTVVVAPVEVVGDGRRRGRGGGGGAPVSFGLARAHGEVRMSEGSAEVVSGGGEGVGVARWGGNGAAGELGSGEQLRRRRGFSEGALGQNRSRGGRYI